MKKVLNIDEFLKENGVEIVINGRSYEVMDIPLEVSLILSETPVDYKKAVKCLLGCDEGALDGLGLAALSKIIAEVHENLLPTASSADNQ